MYDIISILIFCLLFFYYSTMNRLRSTAQHSRHYSSLKIWTQISSIYSNNSLLWECNCSFCSNSFCINTWQPFPMLWILRFWLRLGCVYSVEDPCTNPERRLSWQRYEGSGTDSVVAGAERSEGGLPELQAGSPLGPKFGNRSTCPLWRGSGLKGGPEIKFGQEVEVYSQMASADWPWPGIVVPVGGVGVKFPL